MAHEIVLSDRWTVDDQLGFADFRESLRRAIVNGPTPVTIGIFGDWGSGKTSLMRMLEEDLRDTHRTVWFDAWKFSDQEVLSRALVMTLVRRLRAVSTDLAAEDSEALDQLEQQLYHDRTRDVTGSLTLDWREAAKCSLKLGVSMLPVVGGSFSELRKQLTGDAASDLQGVLGALRRDKTRLHAERIRHLDAFQDAFADLVPRCLGGKKRLVVFIDDLDRCLPEDAIRVLETVKLYLDVNRCVFVVGVDSRVVEQGIRVRYRDFRLATQPGDEGHGTDAFPISGQDYLEKLIQLPFHLPPIQAGDMSEFVAALYTDCPEGLPAVYAAGLEANPRKVKRAVSIFRLLWDVAQRRRDLRKVIHAELLAKLLVIQSRWRDTLYADIKQTPEVLQVVERMVERLQAQERPARDGDDAAESQRDGVQSVAPGPASPQQAGRLPARAARDAQGGAPETPGTPTPLDPEGKYGRYAQMRPIRLLFGSGTDRFARLPAAILYKHVFLANTTSVGQADVEPVDQDLWSRLLSPDEAIGRNACHAVAELPEPERSGSTRRLAAFLDDHRPPLPQRRAAGLALALLGDPRLGEMVHVPGGQFRIGEPEEETTVELAAFEIDRYPVTNAQYGAFVREAGHRPPVHWPNGDMPAELANHPVVAVSWRDAVAYAEWAGKRLPSEAEWEAAARGTEPREFPWGNDWDDDACNSEVSRISGTAPVGIFPRGRSPYDVDDMVGNVWEWCSTKWRSSMKQPADDSPQGDDPRVLRGGCFLDSAPVRCAFRRRGPPGGRHYNIGCRCARRFSSSPSSDS